MISVIQVFLVQNNRRSVAKICRNPRRKRVSYLVFLAIIIDYREVVTNDVGANTGVGTCGYVAPEILRKDWIEECTQETVTNYVCSNPKLERIFSNF